jgi:hypothetical protein
MSIEKWASLPIAKMVAVFSSVSKQGNSSSTVLTFLEHFVDHEIPNEIDASNHMFPGFWGKNSLPAVCWGKPMTDGRRFSATAIKAHTFISTQYSNPSTL